jgi:hypothetical protein
MQKGQEKHLMFQVIEKWKTSGLTQREYCKQQDIVYHVFHYWYKVYRDEQQARKTTSSAFVALQVQEQKATVTTTSTTTTTDVELLLPDGKRLLFHGLVDACFLRLLLQ